MKIETFAIYAAADPNPVIGAVNPPIYLSERGAGPNLRRIALRG